MKKCLLLCLPLCLFVGNLWAQGCSLCSINAASLGKNAGIGLNRGILYLAMLPLLAVAALGILWYRRNYRFEEKSDNND